MISDPAPRDEEDPVVSAVHRWGRRALLEDLLSAEAHRVFVATLDDPELASR